MNQLASGSEANILTLDCGEGKGSVYCRAPYKEDGWLMLKTPKLRKGFQQSILQGQVREGGDLRVSDQLMHNSLSS